MLPLALPGLVLAFGYVAGFDFQAWLTWLNPRENPTLLLIISYSVRRLPYIVRSAYAGFQQTSVTLEEASANLGASPLRTLRKITLPLVMANLIAGTILTFSFAMLEVSDGLILAMQREVLPDHQDDLPAHGPHRSQRARRGLRAGRGGHGDPHRQPARRRPAPGPKNGAIVPGLTGPRAPSVPPSLPGLSGGGFTDGPRRRRRGAGIPRKPSRRCCRSGA